MESISSLETRKSSSTCLKFKEIFSKKRWRKNWEKWSTKGKSSGLIRKGTLSSLIVPLFTCILSEQKLEIRRDYSVLKGEKILPLTEPTICSTDLASGHPNSCLTACYHPLYKIPCIYPTLHHLCLKNRTSFFFFKTNTYYRANHLSHGLRAILSSLCNIGFSS